jgi:ABC-2 type transport system permease protein
VTGSTQIGTAARAPISTARSAWLVAEREITTRLRSKSFMISTAILLLLVLGSIVVGALMAANDEATKVAVVGDLPVTEVEGIEAVAADDLQEAEQLVSDGDVEAAIVADDSNPTGVRVIADTDAPNDVVALLSVSPPIELLDPNATDPGIAYLVALGFGLVFFASAMTFGTTIAQSVVEEKQTRVIELLIAAIPARALLAGKVLGTSILAFGQIALIVAVSIIGLTVTGQDTLLVGLGAALVWFVIFFAIGFVLLAALFAATGAMVSRQEDIGATTTPVTMLIMIPYLLVVFFNDNPLVVSIMSYVPFSAPVGMPLRLFLGTAEWWEPLVSLAILVVTTVVLIAAGARIYENSLLKLGTRVGWREALTR